MTRRRATVPLAALCSPDFSTCLSCESAQLKKVRRFTEMLLDIVLNQKIRHCLIAFTKKLPLSLRFRSLQARQTMFCGQCVRLSISIYFMSIGPAAVTAARPLLAASAVVDRAVHEAISDDHEPRFSWNLDDPCKNFGARRPAHMSPASRACECQGATVPSKECSAFGYDERHIFR